MKTPSVKDTIAALAAAILLASCASAPPTTVNEAVGPAVADLRAEQQGFLTVYSATAWTMDSDGPDLLTYSNYEINAADGRLFKQVENADQTPTRVSLRKGIYTVVAQSDSAGTITVPVAIETGKTTVLHLERPKDWQEPSAGARGVALVRLPNGQAIGFRARNAESVNGASVAEARKRSLLADSGARGR